MSYKTILVHCDASDATATRIAVSCDLARRSGAHLVGLHVRAQFEPPFGFDDSAFSMEAVYRQYLEQANADVEKSAAIFRKVADGQGVATEWRVVTYAYEAVVEHARYVDLVVVGQSDPDAPVAGVPADLPEAVALRSGRPVLVVPATASPTTLGKTILLCWNGSREAARAAADALSLLQAAQKVIVVTIDSRATLKDEERQRTTTITTWLARHDIKATIEHESGADADAGTLILSSAAYCGADLIVMGAYGHSRMREMVLGGASRTLLARTTVPVFMSH